MKALLVLMTLALSFEGLAAESEAPKCAVSAKTDCWNQPIYSDCFNGKFGRCIPIGEPDIFGVYNCKCKPKRPAKPVH